MPKLTLTDQVSSLLATESLSEITYRDVTVTLDKPMPVGADVMGYPIILSTQDFAINVIDPPSAVVDDYKAHGAVLDAYGVDTQGFDESIGQLMGLGASSTPYDNAVNVDPGNTGQPIQIAQGSSHVLVKAVRKTGVTFPNWLITDRYVPFTILGQRPAADLYRPGYCNASQTIRTRSDLDLSVLRSLTPPASGAPSYATIVAYDEGTYPLFGHNGERRRRFQVGPLNYSGDFGIPRAAILYALHRDDLTNEQKRTLAEIVVRHGLDVYSAYQRGFVGEYGAGQAHGYHSYLWYAAFLLQDADMLAAAKAMKSNGYSNVSWIGASDVGVPVAYPDAAGQLARYMMTYFDEEVGSPFWAEKTRGSQNTARYFGISAPVGTTEMFPVALLQDGPGGVTGYDAILQGGPFDATNPHAAALALFDRFATITNPGVSSRGYWSGIGAEVFNAWEHYDTAGWRDVIPLARWTGIPEMYDKQDPSNGNLGASFFYVGGDGEITWNLGAESQFSGTLSTLPITRYDARYSLDGIQFVEVQDVGASGSLSNLLRGVAHYCQIRAVNAAGAGKWSVNYPFSALTGDPERNVITTTGTATAAAPQVVVGAEPLIFYRPYPRWLGPYYEVAPASPLGDDVVTLYAGAGYYTGYPAPTITYQWKRDGVAIDGATEQFYTRQIADFDTDLTCDVTATNASGSVTTETQAVIVPSAPTVPAGIIIDTDFSAAFPLYNPEVAASQLAAGGTATHDPFAPFLPPTISEEEGGVEGATTTPGGIYTAKAGSHPNMSVNLAADVPLEPGGKYRMTADLPVGLGPSGVKSWLNDGNWALGKCAPDCSLYSYHDRVDTYPIEIAGQPYIKQVSFDFTVAQVEPEPVLWMRITAPTGTGGTSGGNPTLSKAKVEKIGENARSNLVHRITGYSPQAAGTSHALQMPATVAAGREMLVALSFSGSVTITSVPSGWSLHPDSPGGDVYFYTKTAVGDEGGTTPTWQTSGSSSACFVLLEHDAPNNEVEIAFNNSEGNKEDPPAITPAGGEDDYIVLALAATARTNSNIAFAPQGYSELTKVLSTATIGNTGFVVGAAWAELNGAAFDPPGFKIGTAGPLKWGATVAIR